MARKAQDRFTFLYVRQPGEYAAGHVPVAKLIPIAELDKRLDEIDTAKPTLIYCAIGGGSRVTAQMLAGRGRADASGTAWPFDG